MRSNDPFHSPQTPSKEHRISIAQPDSVASMLLGFSPLKIRTPLINAKRAPSLSRAGTVSETTPPGWEKIWSSSQGKHYYYAESRGFFDFHPRTTRSPVCRPGQTFLLSRFVSTLSRQIQIIEDYRHYRGLSRFF